MKSTATSKKSRPFNHQVIEIGPAVKNLISLYIELFPNQREAAKKIGVSACTINTYNTRSTHIALYVFDKMVKELAKTYPQPELDQVLEGSSLDDLRANAKRQNGAQIDHVMYAINAKVRMLLDVYNEPFPSREAGGAHLGLNPRTFTAYFKGQISSFPRKYFWLMIDDIRARGIADHDLFGRLGINSWEEMIEEKERSHTLKVTKDQLIRKLVSYFKLGSLKEKDIHRSVSNAAERLFGNLGSAIRATIREITTQTDLEVQELLTQNGLHEAVEKLNELQRYLLLYRVKEAQVNKALPRNKKLNIERIMRPYLKMVQEIQDRVSAALEARNVSLYMQEPAETDINVLVESEELHPVRYFMVRRYEFSQSYRVGEVIDHPGLGTGEVLKVKHPNRIVVGFFNKKHGQKELVQNGVAFPEY